MVFVQFQSLFFTILVQALLMRFSVLCDSRKLYMWSLYTSVTSCDINEIFHFSTFIALWLQEMYHDSREANQDLLLYIFIIGIAYHKALVNEDTLLRTHCCPWCFLRLRKLGDISWGHKMFLNKIRNIFCVPDTKFVSATNVARAGKRGNICVGNNVSATMRPRLPGPIRNN